MIDTQLEERLLTLLQRSRSRDPTESAEPTPSSAGRGPCVGWIRRGHSSCTAPIPRRYLSGQPQVLRQPMAAATPRAKASFITPSTLTQRKITSSAPGPQHRHQYDPLRSGRESSGSGSEPVTLAEQGVETPTVSLAAGSSCVVERSFRAEKQPGRPLQPSLRSYDLWLRPPPQSCRGCRVEHYGRTQIGTSMASSTQTSQKPATRSSHPAGRAATMAAATYAARDRDHRCVRRHSRRHDARREGIASPPRRRIRDVATFSNAYRFWIQCTRAPAGPAPSSAAVDSPPPLLADPALHSAPWSVSTPMRSRWPQW